jgi:CheY-like chemotaxis protein
MGGEIGVESTMGKGSTFWFTVVLEKQMHVEEEKILILPAEIQDTRVLIVDDNKTSLDILQRYIEACGLVCDVAWNAEVALTLLHAAVKSKTPYDVVIMDMHMPGMDGRELGRRIKEDPMLEKTRMIVLSSWGMRGDAADMKKIGFVAYLTKPIRHNQLFDCLMLTLSHQPTSDDVSQTLVTRHTITETRKRNVRILIVEDNMVNQKLALRLMNKFGFRADAVANGKEAVRSLEMIPYHLVLMDIQMPEMDGYETTKMIRNAESKVIDHNIPIIAMTAHAMKKDRDQCLATGMNAYVSKPIQAKELLHTIEKQLSAIEEAS